MPGQHEETQKMVDIVKAGGREAANSAMKTNRKNFLPALQELEDQLRQELRAVEDAEAFEDHLEIRHRWERIKGKYQGAIKSIDTIQEHVNRLQKIMGELTPLVDEQVQRAIEFGGYEDNT